MLLSTEYIASSTLLHKHPAQHADRAYTEDWDGTLAVLCLNHLNTAQTKEAREAPGVLFPCAPVIQPVSMNGQPGLCQDASGMQKDLFSSQLRRRICQVTCSMQPARRDQMTALLPCPMSLVRLIRGRNHMCHCVRSRCRYCGAQLHSVSLTSTFAYSDDVEGHCTVYLRVQCNDVQHQP